MRHVNMQVRTDLHVWEKGWGGTRRRLVGRSVSSSFMRRRKWCSNWWSDWYDCFTDVGHDSFILCHIIWGGSLLGEVCPPPPWHNTKESCPASHIVWHAIKETCQCANQSSSWYCMTQYEWVMSQMYEPVIPVASSTKAPFSPPPWHNMKESCPTSISQSYQSLHQLEHHFLLIQDTSGLDHVPPRDISLEWIKKRKEVVSYMQTSHLMNWNTIWQSRVLRKRRTYDCVLCHNFTPCLNFS